MMDRTINCHITNRIFICQRSGKDKLHPSEIPKTNFVFLVNVSSSMDSIAYSGDIQKMLDDLSFCPCPKIIKIH